MPLVHTNCQPTRRRTPLAPKGRVVMTVRGTKLDHAHHVVYVQQLQRARRKAEVRRMQISIHLSHATRPLPTTARHN
jgi:hypothetical protein